MKFYNNRETFDASMLVNFIERIGAYLTMKLIYIW